MEKSGVVLVKQVREEWWEVKLEQSIIADHHGGLAGQVSILGANRRTQNG